jgi:hypothetical protein
MITCCLIIHVYDKYILTYDGIFYLFSPYISYVGQQFHQYHPNNQPFLTTNRCTQTKTTSHIPKEIHVIVLVGHKYVVGLERLLTFQLSFIIVGSLAML